MAVLNRTLPRSDAKPATESSLRLGPILLIAAATLVVIAILQVVQTSQATTTSFSIQQMKQEKLELESAVRELEAEVGALSSLQRIEREAERLGLAPAAERMTVRVNVPLPEVESGGLPSRFAPGGGTESEASGSPWWRDLIEALPFY